MVSGSEKLIFSNNELLQFPVIGSRYCGVPALVAKLNKMGFLGGGGED